MSWVEVSKEGLAKVLARRGIEFAVYELLQNSFDEAGVTRVAVTIEDLGRSWCKLIVEDDAPEGFRDIAHAYTLFAESYKKDNAEQRGRYDMGDKLVIAVCRRARITTTTGSVIWEGDKRSRGHKRTEAGSMFEGEVPAKDDDRLRMEQAVRTVLCPMHVALTLNGERIPKRKPLRTLTGINLQTEIGEHLRRTRRDTTVTLYALKSDESARIYEMGIPVVEIDCAWDLDIGQKVPLNMDRDNVTPAYLREVRTAVVNAMHDELPAEHAAKPWVSEALGSKDIEPEAVKAIITARHGEKAVIADPSDREAEGISVAKGYQVVHGGSYSAEQWTNIKRSEAILPAGQVNPSPKPWSTDPNAPTAELLAESEWTDGMRRVAGYVTDVGRALCDVQLQVQFYRTANQFTAAYGKRGPGIAAFQFNVKRLGNGYFDVALGAGFDSLNELVIHELGHQFSGNHLSEEYHEALCGLGSKLTRLALDDPDFFRKHRDPASQEAGSPT